MNTQTDKRRVRLMDGGRNMSVNRGLDRWRDRERDRDR